MSLRNRAWRRKKNFYKGKRKKNICISVCGDHHWYKYDGQYIKGKIHCSCPYCSPKTNNRGNYGKAINYKHSDKQKIDMLNLKNSEYHDPDF